MLPPFFRLLFFLWGRHAGAAALGAPPNSGILLEDGTSFLLAESGDFLVLE